MLPAKIIPSRQACYVSYNGLEIFKPNFEYLSGTGFSWVGSSNGHAPTGAVSTGNTSSGELLVIGRAHHEGAVTPGKVHKSHGCLYLPYAGEHFYSLKELIQNLSHHQVLNIPHFIMKF